ncbi:phospholipase D/nuclease [Apiospora aurea]|uniref:Phospholipase D/nuclease n=1 Tax=Apiospora aurea TaxID=335848 RepID=A0ABR1QFY6_9PEZI
MEDESSVGPGGNSGNNDNLPSRGVKREGQDLLSPTSRGKIAKHTFSTSPGQTRPAPFGMTYPNGGLRITRAPGRRRTKNCVGLGDIIDKDHLVSACIFAFYIADEELLQHLPISRRSANSVPSAAIRAGIPLTEGKLTKKSLDTLRPHLADQHKTHSHSGGGQNLHAFYAWSPGSAHSKILLLVYPAFLDSVRGWYDYASVKVYLVTSHPGTSSGPLKAEQHGLLRLRKIVRHLGLNLGREKSDDDDDEQVRLEICTASVGNISTRWLSTFYKCALGRQDIRVPEEEENNEAVPDIKLFYPSVDDVRSASEDSQDAASNIGCHLRPWNTAPQAVKRIFHHYHSRDIGRLFHQKLIIAYNPDQPHATPHYIYVGSANLSQSAWGSVTEDKTKKGNEATCHTKLAGVSNFECGVVIPGRLISDLLEPGTESWEGGVVPYDRAAAPYDLKRDKPWNDPRWVKGYSHDYEAL